MAKKPRLKISPSRLNDYYACPAKYAFSQRMRPLKVSQALTDGTAAHALIEGKIPDTINPRVQRFHWAFQRLEKPYEILDREVFQTVDFQGFQISRKIDAFARIDGEDVLVDFKTSTWGWQSEEGNAPKGMGFQSVCYLIPPDDPAPFKKWPTRIDFLVAPENAADFIFTYRYSEEDLDNLKMALENMEAAPYYPKVRGFGCKYCDYLPACFELEGWEDKFDIKGE